MYEEVCRLAHGDKFASEAMEQVRKQGYFNAIQNYFGLHYVAHFMPEGNEDYLNMMKESGFGWFEKFEPQIKI